MRHLSGGSTCSVRSRNPIRDAESANDGGRGGRGNTQSGEMSPAAAPVLNFSLDPYAPVPHKVTDKSALRGPSFLRIN